MHKHATDLENMLAAQKYERDECMGIDLSKWTRDAGMESDHSAEHEGKDKYTAEDWSWVAYFICIAIAVGYIVWGMYPAFVALYNSIIN